MEPMRYAWILPGRLAAAERPGRGGRSHRRLLREREIAWWQEQGITAVVSGMRTRHALADYAAAGLTVRWLPLRDPDHACEGGMDGLVAAVRELLGEDAGAVLVHCDRANEWLAAIDATLRMELGLARSPRAALRAARADGLPVGSLATSIVGRPTPAA
jgi:hypothetical protein